MRQLQSCLRDPSSVGKLRQFRRPLQLIGQRLHGGDRRQGHRIGRDHLEGGSTFAPQRGQMLTGGQSLLHGPITRQLGPRQRCLRGEQHRFG